jgi:DNA transformation protein and related proteins
MKEKSDLSGYINIGKDTEKKLIEAGIDTFEKLKNAGCENAFLRLQTIDPGACLCLLYGLEGAIEGKKWCDISPEKKEVLKAFFKMAKKINK